MTPDAVKKHATRLRREGVVDEAAWVEAASTNSEVLTCLREPLPPRATVASAGLLGKRTLNVKARSPAPSPRDHQSPRFLREADRQYRAFSQIFDDPVREGLKPADGLVSVGVKDMMLVEGVRNSCGTNAWEAVPAPTTAHAVSQLLRAGCRVDGMVTMHALAYGATGLSSEGGPARNALDSRLMPGGSSSGSAVAVSAGLVDVSLGTDTGGSIRIPAALNGAVGLKPTIGHVSNEGVMPLAPSVDHVGVLVRHVADACWALTQLTGRPGLELPREAEPLLGVPVPYFLDELDEATRERWHRFLDAVRAKPGLEIVDVELRETRMAPVAQLAIMGREALHTHSELLSGRAEFLPADVRRRLELGVLVDEGHYQAALTFRRWWIREVDNALQDCDALLLPTLPIAAPRVEDEYVDLTGTTLPVQACLTRLTSPFNISGHPAISVPCPRPDFPFSYQLIGPRGRDAELLAVADRIQHSMAEH